MGTYIFNDGEFKKCAIGDETTMNNGKSSNAINEDFYKENDIIVGESIKPVLKEPKYLEKIGVVVAIIGVIVAIIAGWEDICNFFAR